MDPTEVVIDGLFDEGEMFEEITPDEAIKMGIDLTAPIEVLTFDEDDNLQTNATKIFFLEKFLIFF